MSWGVPNRPKISTKLGRPTNKEGADGDIQIKGTGLGAKLFAKWSGRWWDVPLSIDGKTKIGVTDSDYLSIDRDSVDIYKNSSKVAEFGSDILLKGGTIIVGAVGASKSNVQITGGAINLRTNTTNKVSLSTAGVLTMGDFKVESDGSLEINGKITTGAGTSNILIGTSNTDAGNYNIGIGVNAMEDAEASSSSNVAIGYWAGRDISTSDNNVLIGRTAGQGVNTGDNNICIGSSSGLNITTGTNNVCIGKNTQPELASANGNILLGTTTSPVRIVQEVDIRYAHRVDLSTIVELPGVKIPAGSVIVSCSVIAITLADINPMTIAVYSRSVSGSSEDIVINAVGATYTELIGKDKDNIMTGALNTDIDIGSSSGNLDKAWYTNDISSLDYTVDSNNDEYVYIVNRTGNGMVNPTAGTVIVAIEYIGHS